MPAAAPFRKPPPSLWLPSIKFVFGAVLVIALAGAIGTAAGLPPPVDRSNPVDSSSGSPTASVAPYDANTLVGGGTAAILELGPFHPVLGPIDYGAADARFGASRSGHSHAGQDVFAPKGTPLVAVSDGVVSTSISESHPFSSGRGNYVAIYDPQEDRSYAYLHLLKPSPLETGDKVRAGEVIGLMGCTGSCYGVHLHFEIRKGRATVRSETPAIDPLPFLKSLPQAPRP